MDRRSFVGVVESFEGVLNNLNFLVEGETQIGIVEVLVERIARGIFDY